VRTQLSPIARDRRENIGKSQVLG